MFSQRFYRTFSPTIRNLDLGSVHVRPAISRFSNIQSWEKISSLALP